MGNKTAIEWTDATWNPIRGCSRVSEGCKNCYAESQANRFKGPGLPYAGLIAKGGQWNGQIKFVEERLMDPIRWKKPRRIFVNSMSDLFHENVTDDQIDKIFAVMACSQEHTFQVLTKRPERMLDYLKGHAAGGRHIWTEGQKIKMPRGRDKPDPGWPLPNVWLGVSVEDQATADERIPLLMKTPAAVRFLSCEPLLGPVDLTWVDNSDGMLVTMMEPIDWVIAGGESGPGSRPMHPDWVRSLRDQCRAAGVPFFFKQWGDYLPDTEWKRIRGNAGHSILLAPNNNWILLMPDGNYDIPDGAGPARELGEVATAKVGKKKAGSMLDGEEIKEYPVTSEADK